MLAVRLLIALTTLFLCGCTRANDAPLSLSSQIAQAHGADTPRSRTGLAGAIHLELALPAPRFFDARFTHDLRHGRTRLLLADETVLVWDGHHAWVSPPTAPVPKPRPLLHIWPLLVTLPLKITSPQARLSDPAPATMAGSSYLVTELTLPAEDPLTLYLDPDSRRIHHIALSARLANEIHPSFDKPVAISFYNFQSIEGVQFPETWRLWSWTRHDGINGGPLAEIRVYNLEFLTPKPDAFSPRPGARQVR